MAISILFAPADTKWIEGVNWFTGNVNLCYCQVNDNFPQITQITQITKSKYKGMVMIKRVLGKSEFVQNS
jgi:hypothetical protein